MDTQRIISLPVSVKIDVEPKSVLHTSPEILADAEKRFSKR